MLEIAYSISPSNPRNGQIIYNISLHYQYIVNQTGDENKESHQLGDIVWCVVTPNPLN